MGEVWKDEYLLSNVVLCVIMNFVFFFYIYIIKIIIEALISINIFELKKYNSIIN